MHIKGKQTSMEAAKSCIHISPKTLESWQGIVDIMAEIFDVPAARIMRLNHEHIEVLVSNSGKLNPYKPGYRKKIQGSGRYCETVVNTNGRLLVPNALEDSTWKNCPDIRMNMISYLGFPILLPDGRPFGTISVLDNKPNAYSKKLEKLIIRFRDIVRTDLDMIFTNQSLNKKNRLIESEGHYNSLFENNHSVMLLIDPETGNIVDANPAAEIYYGWSRNQLTQKRISDINTLSREKIKLEMKQAKREKRNHFYFTHSLASGKIRNVEVYSGPISIGGKKLLYSIIYDITTRKHAEKKLNNLNQELERQVKKRTASLEDLNTALRVLLQKRDDENNRINETIYANFKTLVHPLIDQLRHANSPDIREDLLGLLESNILEVLSPFSRKILDPVMGLTHTEIQVANLVKAGKTNKEISRIMDKSLRAVTSHREQIRQKLGLKNKKVNLRTYLLALH